MNGVSRETLENRVSVPYRGATFLNKKGTGVTAFKKMVSVPYRGATFLNNTEAFTVRIWNTYRVSVPYRGATFLNPVYFSRDRDYSVSVPYRGATFLNTIPATPCPVWDE